MGDVKSMEEGSTSFSEESLLKHKLEAVRYITHMDTDTACLLKVIEKNNQKLLQQEEEIIKLRTQLKICEGSLKLRDAEIAFETQQTIENLEAKHKKWKERFRDAEKILNVTKNDRMIQTDLGDLEVKDQEIATREAIIESQNHKIEVLLQSIKDVKFKLEERTQKAKVMKRMLRYTANELERRTQEEDLRESTEFQLRKEAFAMERIIRRTHHLLNPGGTSSSDTGNVWAASSPYIEVISGNGN